MPHSLPMSHMNKYIFLALPLPSLFCELPQGSVPITKEEICSVLIPLPAKWVRLLSRAGEGRESEDTWELQSALQHLGADFARKAQFPIHSWIASALSKARSPHKGCRHSWWGHMNTFQNGRQNHEWSRRGYEGGSHMEVDSHDGSVNEYKTEKYNNSVGKELGVTASHKLNMNPPCPAVVKKANILLSCINKKVVCQAHKIILPVHSELSVRQS